MRILLLNQYYYPDTAATAQLATDLGADLARRGHEVFAVASARTYVGRERLPKEETHDGVHIIRVSATALGRGSKLGRSIDYLTYLAGALWPALMKARPDVIIALSTPPLVAVLGLVAKRLLRARLVYWVMDVYPDLAVNLGALRANGVPARMLARLSRTILESADAVVALDDAMKSRLVSAGAPHARVEVIDNWVDGSQIRPLDGAPNALRAGLGLRDVFTISYSGNMGLGHDFETIVGAMERLRDHPVHWLFIGDGPRKEDLASAARARKLSRVTILPPRARDELPISLTAADASLVTLQPTLAGLLVPSKLYGILAAGLPVLYVGPTSGRVADVIDQHGVGIAVANGDADGLAAAVLRLRADAGARAEMGRRARSLFDLRFDQRHAIERHHDLLLRVANA